MPFFGVLRTGTISLRRVGGKADVEVRLRIS